MGGGSHDPRLLRLAPATRSFVAITVVLGVLTAGLLIAQAWLLAVVISRVMHGAEPSRLGGALSALLAVLLARAAISWAVPVCAGRASTRAKRQLRAALLARATARPGLQRRRTGELTALATRGIDALDGYFALYLPQLALAAIVPFGVLAALAVEDPISAAIVAGTLPLIPLFMALVGASTEERMDHQFLVLQRLAGHFLDVVAGLATLKVFGRAKAQIAAVGTVTEGYRRASLATLRISFLSSLILELVSTISVALVAVEIGLRLLGGDLDLRTALFVLVLVPEAYLPLRQLGASYHASVEGMAAAKHLFAILEEPLPRQGTRTQIPDPALLPVAVEELTVAYPGRDGPALERLSLTLEPGEVLAVTGPSGSGKSTLIGVLLGLVPPTAGSVSIGGLELDELDPAGWRARLAWVPQRPRLLAAPIGENIRLGRPDASPQALSRAVAAAGLRDVVARLPRGLDEPLGDRGAGLSAGERQRVALARAFLRDAPLLLLDEPTANLDGETEEAVLDSVAELARGRTVLLAAHRPALVALADRAFTLDPAAVAA
jgi:ATP-binding cassette, subfamily C, bacterial CydCD